MDSKLELCDGSVLLRPYRISDINDLYEAVRESIAEISLWTDWCHQRYSIKESRTFIKTRSKACKKGISYDFAITDATDGYYLGGCGLNRIELHYGMANLGYWVRTSRVKMGFATAATRLLAQFGFKELGLKRIEIVTDVNNMASQRVAEKSGATREGILRNRLFVRERACDAVMFSLIPGDLKFSG